MSLIASFLRLTWLILQLLDTCKTLKRPDTKRKRVKRLDDDGATQPITATRPRMSTLKRDQWRRLLKSWIVWMAWSYAEAFLDKTIGLFLPFYGQIKVILLLSLSVPRSSTLPYIYDRFFSPWMKRYSRMIDLWTGLFLLIGQYILQLLLCATVVPICKLLDSLRKRSWNWRRWKSGEPEVVEIDQVDEVAGGQDASAIVADQSSTNNDRPSPTTPPAEPQPSSVARRKPRKSVLDNVIEFSLGSPKTLRQAVHHAKALYDAPRPSGLRQEVKVKPVKGPSKGESETRRPSGIRVEPKGKAPDRVMPVPGRSTMSSKPVVEAASGQAGRQGDTGVTRSRKPVRVINPVASQTTGRNSQTTRTQVPELHSQEIKGSSRDPIVLDDRDTIDVGGSVITSRMSKTTEAAFLARLGSGFGAVPPIGPSNSLALEAVAEEGRGETSSAGENTAQPVATTSGQLDTDLENDAMFIEQAEPLSTEDKLTPRKRKATENPVEKRTGKTRKLDESVVVDPGKKLAQGKVSAKGSNTIDSRPSRTRARKVTDTISTGPTTTAKAAATARLKPTRIQNDERPRTRSARRKEETVDASRSASPTSVLLPIPPPEPVRPKRTSGNAGVGTKRVARDLGQPRRPDNR